MKRSVLLLLTVATGTAEMCGWYMQELRDNSCLTTSNTIVCTDECMQMADELRMGKVPGMGCKNFKLCDKMVGCSYDGCDANVMAAMPKEVLQVKEPYLPFSNDVDLKCVDQAGNTEIQMPCMSAGQTQYWLVDIHNISAFQYEVFNRDGSDLQLTELYSISNSETDDIFDCYSEDTVATTTCHNSFLSKGIKLPPHVVFFPKITIRFGFKACEGYSAAACAANPPFLSFKTTGVKTISGTFSETVPGCVSAVTQQAMPLPSDKICRV